MYNRTLKRDQTIRYIGCIIGLSKRGERPPRREEKSATKERPQTLTPANETSRHGGWKRKGKTRKDTLSPLLPSLKLHESAFIFDKGCCFHQWNIPNSSWSGEVILRAQTLPTASSYNRKTAKQIWSKSEKMVVDLPKGGRR